MIALVVALQLMVVYLPALNTFFKTQPLGQAEMAVLVVSSVAGVLRDRSGEVGEEEKR
jgi:hypothetical protein